MPFQWLKQWFPHLPSALERAPMAGLMCAGALLLGVAIAGARSTISNEKGVPAAIETTAASIEKPAGENSEKASRFREDEELLDQSGQFSMNGDRIVFEATKSHHRFTTLENLPLERVSNAIAGNSAPMQWIVSGKITLYRGSYYLLLTSAQRKSPLAPAESKP